MATLALVKRVGLLLIGLCLFAMAGCGSDPPDATAPPPTTESGPFAEFDAAAQDLVEREATWQAPSKLTVGHTERVGLAIGDSKALKSKIDTLLPSTAPVDAGSVQVGPMVTATLLAAPGDADVTPSEGVNLSTGSDLQLLWTWLVHAKRPTDTLLLTARLEVPLSNGHSMTQEIPLTLSVDRTFGYTAEQVATHWGTWSAVVASLGSGVAWLVTRRRRKAGQQVTEA